MKYIILIFFFLLNDNVKSQTWSTIDSLLTNNLSLYGGAVVAIVNHGDSLVYYNNWGGYDSLTQKAIASLTKTFSGAVMLRLVQDSVVRLDDSIGIYLPYATLMGKGSNTIRQNFSHTAGWEGVTGNLYLTNPSLNMQQCVDSILTYDNIIYTPGSMFKYTGVSMQVAARATEIASGQDWNTLWTNKIKNPLGLNNTQFGVITNPRVAGGLVSTPSDIMKLARFILRNGKNDLGIQVVDSIWMQELWKDQTNQAPVIAMPYPYNPPYNNPYNADTIRYGIGTWLDIYNPTENYQEQISGGGAFGSIMWVNRCNNTCGVVFTYANYGNVWPTTFQVIDVVNSIYPNQCYQFTGINENDPKHFENIKVFPNPTNNVLHLEPGLLGENYTVELINSMGQQIGSYNNPTLIDLSTYSIGLYFIKIQSGNQVFTKKIIKQ